MTTRDNDDWRQVVLPSGTGLLHYLTMGHFEGWKQMFNFSELVSYILIRDNSQFSNTYIGNKLHKLSATHKGFLNCRMSHSFTVSSPTQTHHNITVTRFCQ